MTEQLEFAKRTFAANAKTSPWLRASCQKPVTMLWRDYTRFVGSLMIWPTPLLLGSITTPW